MIESEQVKMYENAVRFGFTISGESEDTLVVLVEESGQSENPTIPTEENIRYIDQDSTGNFILFPNRLEDGKSYGVYVSNSTVSYTKVAGFQYYQSYKLGDVDGNGKITVGDASDVLQHVVGNKVLSGNLEKAADVDRNGSVTVGDAGYILQYVVGNGNPYGLTD